MYNQHYLKLKENLEKQKCPNGCDSKVGIDNWGMFYGERDWFYYCLECDDTWKNNLK